MGKKKRFFWHVPLSCWYSGNPIALGGNGNVAGDIIATLVDTEGGTGLLPVNDLFTVERIIGQYMFTADEDPAANHFVHSRVYVAESDATAIALRSIQTADDAETSFLWHQVDPWHSSWDGDAMGSWQTDAAAGSPAATPWKGRLGNVDIRVGRRLEGGESLIWHSQIVFPPAADNVFYLKLWLRMLVSEN